MNAIQAAILLSPHFKLGELCKSATAERLGIDNGPPPHVLQNLRRLAVELEKIRDLTGKPLVIHSGYRSPALNARVGGSKNSYHMLGCAADFDPPAGMSHDELQHAIEDAAHINFDLVLEEKAKDGAHWLHFQVARPGERPRRRVKDATLDVQGGAITRVSAG